MTDRSCSYLRAHGEAETRSQPTRQAAGLLLLTSDLQDVRAADQPPIVHVAEPALHAGGKTTVAVQSAFAPMPQRRRGRTRSARRAALRARHLMSLPVVLPHPTNTQLKRTRQGFCWGCGASLKEPHSFLCELDGKRLRRDAPARVAIVVRAAAGRSPPPAPPAVAVTLHVHTPVPHSCDVSTRN